MLPMYKQSYPMNERMVFQHGMAWGIVESVTKLL